MTTDAIGGIWTYSLDLGRALARKEFKVVLAVLGPGLDPIKSATAAQAGIEIVDTGISPEWLAGDAADIDHGAATLATLARTHDTDLVHLNHPAFAAGGHFEAPVLSACHSCLATWWEAVKETALPDDFRWRTELVARGYRASQRLVAPSRAFAEATKRLYGLAELPDVVHNGRATGPSTADLTAPVDAVFTVGRLWDEGKNARTLDRIAALSTAPFRAAGPTRGPNGAEVILTHLEVLGPLPEPDIRARFAERPVYVTAARFEPFGLAVLEAAQAGCALVLSDIESLRELWNDAALFVSPNDEEAFAAAVGRLLSDPELRADYANAAQNRSRAFGLDAFVDDMATLYRAMLPAAGADRLRRQG